MRRVSAHRLIFYAAATALTWLVTGSAVAAPDETAPPVAPNTVARAWSRAEPAVVKLYGPGIGREHGYSTGFIVSADGQILTALSLLTSTGRPRVVLSDGRRFEAAVERTDPVRKLALLRIEAKDLPHVELASTESLRPGDAVLALGNWFKIADGREPVSINRGILSMKGELDARRLTQEYDYRGNVLFIDAMTSNPGAPGGPLLDVDGRCIGMIGRIVESADTNTRINYALPSEELIAFLGGEILSTPTTQAAGDDAAEPYIGIRISRLGFRHVPAYVARVEPGSPAADAGLKRDDLIASIDGRRIADAREFDDAVADLRPGQEVAVVVKRGSQLVRLNVKVAAREKPQ